MRLVTFEQAGLAPRLGVVSPDGAAVLDAGRLAKAHQGSVGAYRSMLELIEAGPVALSKLEAWATGALPAGVDWIALTDVRLRAPLLRPPRLRCFSVYERHLVQAFRSVLRHKMNPFVFALVSALGLIKAPKKFFRVPVYYKGNHLAISGPNDTIPWPSYSRMLDYELEIAIIIGAPGIDVPVERAAEHIFGYTIFNDFSARDALMTEVGFGPSAGPAKGKDFDGSNAFGPWIVTADEMGDPATAEMVVSVNGVERGRAKAGEAAHSFSRLVSYASRGEALQPGEILACGAVGDGTGIEFWSFLQPGDRVELKVERIGVLSNTIGPQSAHAPL